MPRSAEEKQAVLATARTTAQAVARQAGRRTPGLEFTGVLGVGGNASVLSSRLTGPPARVVYSNCGSKTNVLRGDTKPAVKLQTVRKGSALVGKREYELMRWAAQRGFGVPVYCEATWHLKSGETYHLILMKKMEGDLLSLTLNKAVHPEVKQFAWHASFDQISRASRAVPATINLDLKPENILVDVDADRHVTGVFLSDFDGRFWKSLKSQDEALLFNYVVFVSNCLFPEGGIPGLCDFLPPSVLLFAKKLTGTWSRSSKFLQYAKRNDSLLSHGTYYYALGKKLPATAEQRARAFVASLQRAGKYYGAKPECSPAAKAEASPPLGAQTALKLAKDHFE